MIANRTYLTSLLTFPGVILRQVIHAGICRLLRIEVLQIRYFRFDTPAGYVLHAKPSSFGVAFFLALVPWLVHSICCVTLCAPIWVRLLLQDSQLGCSGLFLLWLGISVGVHAFQANREGENFWDLTRQAAGRNHKLLRLTFPFALFFRTAQRLSRFGFDLVYAVVLGVALPVAFVQYAFP